MGRTGPRSKIAVELHEEVCCLVLAGVPADLIGRELGVAGPVVRRVVRQHFPQWTAPKIPPALHDDVCVLVLAGVESRLIAEELGVSLSTVQRVVRKRFPNRSRPRKVSERDVAEVVRRVLAGEKVYALAEEFGVHSSAVSRWTTTVRRMKRVEPGVDKPRSGSPMSFEEREEISRGLEAGDSASEIARRLKRSPSTITRELKRCGGRPSYRAWKGERRACEQRKRPKEAKLATNARLRARVEEGLANCWSPEQIAGHLPQEFPHDTTMRVSHETIYQSLYVQGRGALRAELKRYLRWKRLHRRKRSATEERRGKIPHMVMISDRPAEASDRALPGHWEGDLIIGRDGKSAIATLVERRSRYVLLAALPNGRTADAVNAALIPILLSLPEHLRNSLTWDQGKELSHHVAFSIATGVQVYFCNPHSPWERGSNENTNGLLRQFLPKTSDLRRKSQLELDEIARLLNHRPRQTLNWMKPYEVLNAAIGASTG